MRMKDMLWSKEEEEEGTVKATCDLLSNSYLYLRKTITSSTSKELRDNVNFSEWFLGIWGWRLLSSHITNKTFWKPSLILFVYKFYSFRHRLPFFCCFCQRDRWKGCIVYESGIGHHGVEMMNRGLQTLFGFLRCVLAALRYMRQRLCDSAWRWSTAAGFCVGHGNSEENDGNC